MTSSSLTTLPFAITSLHSGAYLCASMGGASEVSITGEGASDKACTNTRKHRLTDWCRQNDRPRGRDQRSVPLEEVNVRLYKPTNATKMRTIFSWNKLFQYSSLYTVPTQPQQQSSERHTIECFLVIQEHYVHLLSIINIAPVKLSNASSKFSKHDSCLLKPYWSHPLQVNS
jgi:hypothetical protein